MADGHSSCAFLLNSSYLSTRMRCSYKYATIIVCFLNLVTIIFLLQALLGPFYKSSKAPRILPVLEQAKYIMEAEEIRRAMEPMDLIKRLREIQQESESEAQKQGRKKASRPKNAREISKRLKDLRAATDQSSQKALEEWRKRKLERAKKREMEKNGTSTEKVVTSDR